MRQTIPVLVLAVAASGAWAEEPAQALARGKLASDLRHHREAVTVFSALADSSVATPAQRWEARVRLGGSLRAAGDGDSSRSAFERAWETRTEDPEDLRFLLQALGSPLPGNERWEEVWKDVHLRFDGGAPPRVLWPGVPDRPCPRTGHPVSLDFEDQSLLGTFRLFADITGFNVVVNPGVSGAVSLRFQDAPWDQVLCEGLAPSGYVAQHVGNVLWIGLPEQASARTTFSGEPIDVDLENVDLVDALSRVAAEGGARVEVAPGIGGRVTLVLFQVPWDHAFDVIVNVNGLTWSREDDVLSVALR
jgi:hypothetical protein